LLPFDHTTESVIFWEPHDDLTLLDIWNSEVTPFVSYTVFVLVLIRGETVSILLPPLLLMRFTLMKTGRFIPRLFLGPAGGESRKRRIRNFAPSG
jgi:hypothetical protein